MVFSFFQTFIGPKEEGDHTYDAERWHWSYSPIAQAILTVIRNNETVFALALNQLWDELEGEWNKNRQPAIPLYSWVRKVWGDYVYTLGVDWPAP